LFPKGHIGNGVTGVIKDPHRLFQRRLLSFIRLPALNGGASSAGEMVTLTSAR
jgi:hypothetical protein